MPLTGALQADFSDFVTEANKASAALGVMDAEAKKTGTTLAKTGAAVDGIGATAGKSSNSLLEISGGLRQLDASANAAGVSLNKPIAMIEEIAQVSGKSAAQLGALGTAAAVAGAALGGWSVGRWIADMTGSDAIIGRMIANLTGMGDRAEIAANRAEVLAKASATSGRTITDMTEAIKINYDAVKGHTAAIDTAIHRQALWEKEIRGHRDALPAITAALDNHTATTAQLAKQYGMTAEAITYYVAKTKDQTAAQDEANRKTEAAAAAQQKLRDSMFGGDSITKANELVAALGGVSNLSRMTAEEQAKLNAAVGEAVETYDRWGKVAPTALNEIYNATVSIGKVTTGLGSEFASLGTKFTPTADHIIANTQKMTAEAAAYEAETRAMVDAAQQIAPPIAKAEEETRQLTVAFNQASSAIRMTASESIAAGKVLEDAYRQAGIFVGQQIATGGYQQSQRLAAGREITGAGQTWGNTLNVNVNSTEAGDISKKLVDEMRRNGVRF
jgi:hypothetical protein